MPFFISRIYSILYWCVNLIQLRIDQKRRCNIYTACDIEHNALDNGCLIYVVTLFATIKGYCICKQSNNYKSNVRIKLVTFDRLKYATRSNAIDNACETLLGMTIENQMDMLICNVI